MAEAGIVGVLPLWVGEAGGGGPVGVGLAVASPAQAARANVSTADSTDSRRFILCIGRNRARLAAGRWE